MKENLMSLGKFFHLYPHSRKSASVLCALCKETKVVWFFITQRDANTNTVMKGNVPYTTTLSIKEPSM